VLDFALSFSGNAPSVSGGAGGGADQTGGAGGGGACGGNGGNSGDPGSGAQAGSAGISIQRTSSDPTGVFLVSGHTG
jgi:hypothetical protein